MFRFCGVVGFLTFFLPAQAQQARETFGKNRIQYKEFGWKYLSSENFDVYYYEDRRKVAGEAIQYLEAEFDRITDLIGWPPYLKTKVFLYNSITDLQQSNIGLNHTQFNVGGETEFIKPYVEIAHPGTLSEFKEELIYKVSDLMVNEMMFGGSLKDMFQNAVLLNIPDWFISGASLYVARGWNMEMDDYVRQLVRSKKVNKALKQTGKESQLVGQSIWNFIVEKYGKSSISNILNYTRVIRNEQKSILITLGIPFRQLLSDWQQYYSQIEKRVGESYVAPPDSNRFSPPHRKATVYTTVKISPDGKKVAYAENYRGKFTVKVKSLENGKETIILNGGNKVIKQAVDYRVPLLSWADANTLGVIGIKNGRYIFWLYDLNSRSKLPRQLDRFSNIRSFDFSSNGRLAVVSADQMGQNDLFLVSSRRDRTQRLTNDAFDDLDPSFIPNTNSIVFSSNRTTDTVLTNKSQGLQQITSNYNLFTYNLDTTTNVVVRLTNTLSKDFYPHALDENTFFYLSDQRGIVNLFKFDRTKGIYTQITNFNSSIKDYDLDFSNHTFALVMAKNLQEDIFISNNFNLDRQIFTPTTRRKEVQQAKAITERRKKEANNKVMSIKQLINSRMREKNDTARVAPVEKSLNPTPVASADTAKTSKMNGEVDTDDYTFDEQPTAVTKEPEIPVKKDEKTVNTEDYSFAEEAIKEKQPSETFLTRYMKARQNSRILGPFPYEPKFTSENLITNFVIDPLRSYSIRLETQMNDILENYRFFGGLQTAFDWKSGDVYAEVQYLKHRIDFSFRLDRKVIFWNQPDLPAGVARYLQKYSYQKIEFGASLPISVRTRVTLKPFAGFTQMVDRGTEDVLNPSNLPSFLPTKTQYYTGYKAEVVFDNSLTTGMNIIEGTRGKLNFIQYAGVNGKANFSQISLDLRHYQKIYKEIVFAVRGYAGSFFGNSPKKYALGGMDNWFGNRINYSGLGNPLASVSKAYNNNLLFTEFVTTLRGFDYATLYGTNVMMGNVELRVPLIRALTSGPITSNFFRNMQFTAFYDVGTSWSGTLPFNNNNVARSRIVPEDQSTKPPFRIELNEYLNPWIYSYGFGFRTMMLGYYMKLDLAWPVENYKVQDLRTYVTLGFDF